METDGIGIKQVRFIGYMSSRSDPTAPAKEWGIVWARRAERPIGERGDTSLGDWHWHCAITGPEHDYAKGTDFQSREFQFFGSCKTIEEVPEAVTKAWYAMPLDQLPRLTDDRQEIKRPEVLVWVENKVSFEPVEIPSS